MYQKTSLVGHFMAFTTITIWGTTYISTKVLLSNLSPTEILFYRFFIAYIILLIMYPKFKRLAGLREELLFFGAGFSGVMLYFLIENIALKYTFASNVGLLIAISPIVTTFLANYFIEGERISKKLITGSIIAIGGVFLVISNGNFILRLNPLGDLLALLAAIVWSSYSIILKKIGQRYNYIYTTRKIFFYGLVAIIPLLFIFKASFDIGKLGSPTILPNILYLSLGASSLCFILWNISVNFIGVVKTSNYIYIGPFITVLTAMVVLNERLSTAAIMGGMLILLGLHISEYGFKKIKNVSRFIFKNKHNKRKTER